MTRRHWTTSEDDLLRLSWGVVPMEETIAKLGRTRLAVFMRAKRVGIGGACAQGFESLRSAAKRCGYSRVQLTRILNHGRVRLYRGNSRLAIDAVLRARAGVEGLKAAARRVGVGRTTLWRWLRSAGARGRLSRLDPGVVDRVVAERLVAA